MPRGVGAALATCVVLAFAGSASAATPQSVSQRIFRDLADNGKLDGRYTDAQIERALRSPSLTRYQRPVRLPEPAPATTPALPPVADDRSALPFSGLDLALFGGVGAPLLLLGASLGRLARVRPEEELS